MATKTISISEDSYNILLSRKKDKESFSEVIKKLAGKDVEIVFTEKRKGEVHKNYACIDKAKKILNFHPKISLEEGIKKTLSWFENSGF